MDTFAGQVQGLYAGTWSSTVTYLRGAMVTYNSSLYFSIASSNINNTPSNVSAYWQLMVSSSSGGIGYPPSGVPLSTGSAWSTSYQAGTSASNLVQLNGSAQLPAVSGALLTSIVQSMSGTSPIVVTPTGTSYAVSCPTCNTSGVTSINTTAGAFTFSFSSGAGSCSGTTCTFTGSGAGGGSVTNFVASSGSWPTWLVPSVATSTTTPTLSVSASSIPNSALANSTTTLGATTLTLGSTQTSVTGLTVDGVTPTTMGYLDATSSIQTQLNAKQVTLTLTTTGTSGAATLSGGTLNIPQYSGGGGGGTVTSFSAGNLSPLFTTSVATSTSTPALTFALSNAAQNSVLAGPASGGSGAPSYQTAPTISAANMTNFPTLNQSTTGNAGTATALASSPTQCSGGQFATGVTTSGAANCDGNLNDGGTTANTLTYSGSGGIKVSASGTGQLQPAPGLFSTLPACSTTTVGLAIVTDSTTQTWGATVTGTGTPATPYTAVLCDGVAWTVIGK